MSSNNNSIYFCVVHQQRQVCGYTWKIWWDRTSFYLKGQDKWMASLKVSLHGNDPRHGRPGFKIARDVDAEQTARKAGGVLVTAPGNLPAWFEGRRVAPSVRHAVRFRSDWKMFGLGVPSAPVPKRPKKSTLAAILPAPRNMRALDVDIFVCEREPYWPNQAITSADNASLGPLKNDAGQYLTGRVVERNALSDHQDEVDVRPRDLDPDDRVRGHHGRVEDGVYVLREQWLSRSAMLAASGQV